MNPLTAKVVLELTAKGYELIADQFAATRQNFWGDFSVFDSLVKDGMKVLDVGCGNGRLFEYLKKNHTITYVGIDQNPAFIELAKKKYGNDQNCPQFFTVNILDPESWNVLGSQSFDIIFCIAVLHHMPTIGLRLQTLQSIKNYLADGGFLCMENWNMWELRKGTKTIWFSLARRRAAGIPASELGWRDLVTEWRSGKVTGYLYYYAFTVRELSRLLGRSGFHLVSSYYIRNGKRAHWWNGRNIMTIATKDRLQ